MRQTNHCLLTPPAAIVIFAAAGDLSKRKLNSDCMRNIVDDSRAVEDRSRDYREPLQPVAGFCQALPPRVFPNHASLGPQQVDWRVAQ